VERYLPVEVDGCDRTYEMQSSPNASARLSSIGHNLKRVAALGLSIIPGCYSRRRGDRLCWICTL